MIPTIMMTYYTFINLSGSFCQCEVQSGEDLANFVPVISLGDTPGEYCTKENKSRSSRRPINVMI